MLDEESDSPSSSITANQKSNVLREICSTLNDGMRPLLRGIQTNCNEHHKLKAQMRHERTHRLSMLRVVVKLPMLREQENTVTFGDSSMLSLLESVAIMWLMEDKVRAKQAHRRGH